MLIAKSIKLSLSIMFIVPYNSGLDGNSVEAEKCIYQENP